MLSTVYIGDNVGAIIGAIDGIMVNVERLGRVVEGINGREGEKSKGEERESDAIIREIYDKIGLWRGDIDLSGLKFGESNESRKTNDVNFVVNELSTILKDYKVVAKSALNCKNTYPVIVLKADEKNKDFWRNVKERLGDDVKLVLENIRECGRKVRGCWYIFNISVDERPYSIAWNPDPSRLNVFDVKGMYRDELNAEKCDKLSLDVRKYVENYVENYVE